MKYNLNTSEIEGTPEEIKKFIEKQEINKSELIVEEKKHYRRAKKIDHEKYIIGFADFVKNRKEKFKLGTLFKKKYPELPYGTFSHFRNDIYKKILGMGFVRKGHFWFPKNKQTKMVQIKTWFPPNRQLEKPKYEPKQQKSKYRKYMSSKTKMYMSQNIDYMTACRKAQKDWVAKTRNAITERTFPQFENVGKDGNILLPNMIKNLIELKYPITEEIGTYSLGCKNWGDFITEFMMKTKEISKYFQVEGKFSTKNGVINYGI